MLLLLRTDAIKFIESTVKLPLPAASHVATAVVLADNGTRSGDADNHPCLLPLSSRSPVPRLFATARRGEEQAEEGEAGDRGAAPLKRLANLPAMCGRPPPGSRTREQIRLMLMMVMMMMMMMH